VTIRMAPGSCANGFQHDTDSASRWLVGSSSTKLGLIEQHLQSATRRRSPPEAGHIESSGGNAARPSLIDLAVEIPQTAASISSCSLSFIGGFLGIIDRELIVAVEDRLLLATPASRSRGRSGGSSCVLFEVADPRALGDPASPLYSLSRPAMIRKHVRFAGAVTPTRRSWRPDRTTNGRYRAPCVTG